MLSGAKADLPIRNLDQPGIDRASQQIVDPLSADLTVREILRVIGLRLQETPHLGLRLETTASVPLEGFFQDRGIGLVADQQLAMAGDALEPVADGCMKRPVAVHASGTHAVERLLAVLLALVLRDRSQQVLDKKRVGVIAELDRGAFQVPASFGDGAAQMQMSFEASRQAGDVIDDDGAALPASLAQEGQHILHARPRNQAARAIVLKNLDDLIALELCIFPAARFLAAEPRRPASSAWSKTRARKSRRSG